MTSSPLDSVPEDAIRQAFKLPREIQQDANLMTLHHELVERLMNEANGLPMNTVQLMLLERLSTIYITWKYKEENNAFSRTGEQKEYSEMYLKMTTEFNRILVASAEMLREQLLAQVIDIVTKVVDEVDDDDIRRNLRRAMQEKFALVNL